METKILVVDDDAAIRKVSSRFLKSIGHECETCDSVNAARIALERKSYDLLVTDVKMPGESGVELIRHAKDSYPSMGRVVMTGYGTQEIADEIVDLGVEGYILKPLTRNAFLITVKNALKHSRLTNEMKAYEMKLEEIIAKRTGKLKAIMDNLSVGVVMIDSNMIILELNRKMQHWFPGIQLSEKTVCYQGFVGTEQQQICEGCPVDLTLKSGKTQEVMRRAKTAEGVKEFRIVSTPIFDSDGVPYAAIALYDDMTERMVLERELRQAQKLESVGQLAAGIAHEINTPIQYIGDNLGFLKEAVADIMAVLNTYEQSWQESLQTATVPAKLAEEVEAAKEEADLEFLRDEIQTTIQDSLDGVSRVTNIVRAMKDFAHPGEEQKSSADLNNILESTIIVSRNEWKYCAEMETGLSSELPAIRCFPGDLGQVFLNIIVNAAHAIENAAADDKKGLGKISIKTKQSEFGVQAQISDTGGGIPEHVQHKIFDPFFTTKDRGKGSGQGLAIAYQVVTDKHQGEIRFDSVEGLGTTFTIELPLE